MRRKQIINSAKCEGCIYCKIEKLDSDKLEMVHCLERDRRYIFGQCIEPCDDFKKIIRRKQCW